MITAMPCPTSLPAIIVGGSFPEMANLSDERSTFCAKLRDQLSTHFVDPRHPRGAEVHIDVRKAFSSQITKSNSILALNDLFSKSMPFDLTEHFCHSATFRGCVCCLTFIVARTIERTNANGWSEQRRQGCQIAKFCSVA